MPVTISNHAKQQLTLRGIAEDMVLKVIEKPLEIAVLNDRTVYQAIINEGSKQYLIRVFVNHLKDPNVIITAYKTSKIYKYYEGNL